MVTALKWVAGLLGLFVSLVSLIAGFLVIADILTDVVNDRIIIEPFSTPKFFQENGYSKTVAARQIRRSIIDIQVESATLFETSDLSELQLAWMRPDIAIPETDISAEWVVEQLKGVLDGELTPVGGPTPPYLPGFENLG